MLSQSQQQNAAAGEKIQALLEGELKSTVKYLIAKYGKTFERKLGLSKDDLMNDVREQIWKSLLTHKPSGKANLKTYANNVINNRFKVLLKRSTIPKYNKIDYYGDVFSTAGIDQEHLVTEETGETIFEKRQVILQELDALTDPEKYVYVDLIQGRGIDEIVTLRKMNRVQVIGTIKKIDLMISARVKG
jgi:molybdopterin converting factor small subunit